MRARNDLMPVLVGIAVTALVLLAPLASGPWWRESPRRQAPRIVHVTLEAAPSSNRPDAAPARGAAQAPSAPAIRAAVAAGSRLLAPPSSIPVFATPDATQVEPDSAAFYPYLAALRQRVQAAIGRDGRLRLAEAGMGAGGGAALSIWIGPGGELRRVETAARPETALAGAGRVQQVLIEVATSLDRFPAPPEGLPQPVRIGLEGAELRVGALQHPIEQ